MRNYRPVTQRDFGCAEDATLMPASDTRNRISYANAAFIAVSGFDREEIVGQPYCVVRRADLPGAAFADR